MPQPRAPERFLQLVRDAIREGTLNKLTLGKYRGEDASLKNIFIRPVTLNAGTRFAFLWRHATRDITKNLTADEAVATIESLLARDFLDAHLFTTTQTVQLECDPEAASGGRIRTIATQRP